ncbi:hypothetical protein B296_00026257, partial [Ensete ventricosum]
MEAVGEEHPAPAVKKLAAAREEHPSPTVNAPAVKKSMTVGEEHPVVKQPADKTIYAMSCAKKVEFRSIFCFRSVFCAPSRKFEILAIPNILALGKRMSTVSQKN